VRAISHCDGYTKIEQLGMPQALQFMSVKQSLYYSVCIFIYNTLNNALPVSLRNKIETVESESQRQTRQAESRVGITKN